MPFAEQRTRRFSTQRFSIWAGFAAGPIAAFLQQQVGHALVPWTCAHETGWPVLALGLALALVTAVAGFTSWRARRSENGHDLAPGPGNRRFVAGLSVGLAAFFVLVILAQALAGVFLTGCER